MRGHLQERYTEMIITIKKGNPTKQMAVCLSGSYDYTGATVRLSYQGAVREFTGKAAGDALQFAFTEEETAVMALGTFPIQMSVVLADGRTVEWTAFETSITVTDEDVPGEVLNINAQGALQGVSPIPDTYTDADVKDKINEVIKRLGCVILCAISLAAFADAVTVEKQRKDTIPNNAEIVTDVTVDPSAFTDPDKVREIVSNTVDKAFVEGLGIKGGGEGSSVEIDETLSVKGAAADAKKVGDWLGRMVEDFSTMQYAASAAESKAGTALAKAEGVSLWAQVHAQEFNGVNAKASTAFENANNALAYSSGIYRYMIGNTNAWFEGTNYNVNAEQAANKVKYAPESWENVIYTPPSLQLYEIRDGERKCVWDQRDWTVYYWNFKSSQLSNNLANAVHDIRTNCMQRGWAKYTAVNGLDNPATDTLWVDTPKVSLMAGKQWEKLVTVGGAGYYTLTGNGIELEPADAESTFLTVKDFEGNACLTFRKTSSYLVYCECGTDITRNFTDAQGRVTFHLSTDVQPTGEFSTVIDTAAFVEQDVEGCPVDYEWTGSPGAWDCHFKLKNGIVSQSCFARFKVQREGENIVEYTVPIRMNGGISFEQDGRTYKIKPRVSGSTVTWEVIQ